MTQQPHCDWRKRTIQLMVVANSLLLVAVALYVAGVVFYFAHFNFGSGGDLRGVWLIVAGMLLGILAILGSIVSAVMAAINWRKGGSSGLLLTALLLPVAELLVGFAVLSCL